MKTLSCGILLLKYDRLLLGHATGQTHWDIPKGGIDPGETPIECAIRELKEETSWVVEAIDLVDLGQHNYSSSKNLHLFYANIADWSIPVLEELHCNSRFIDYKGNDVPEFDGFTYARKEDLKHMLGKNLYTLLSKDNFALLNDPYDF